MTLRLAAKLVGGPAVRAKLAKLERAVARKAAREAAGAVTKRVLAAARAFVPVDTATLRRALGRRVKSYEEGRVAYGVVGARKDAKPKAKLNRPAKAPKFRREVRRGGAGRRLTVAVPSRYVHLAEGGARPHAVGRGSSLKKGVQTGRVHPGARPARFLSRAWESAKVEAAKDALKILRAAARSAV